jgi:hypothetical protein
MTRDDIIKLAREAGFEDHSNPELWDCMIAPHNAIARFAALVAQHEREACKRALDAYLLTSDPGPLRARGAMDKTSCG